MKDKKSDNNKIFESIGEFSCNGYQKINDSIKGITLISLVITIIVLLILAGVSIAMLTGENGLLTKANSSSWQTKQQGALEKVKLAVAASWGNDVNINIDELKNNLNNVEGIDKSTIKDTLPMTVTVYSIQIEIYKNGNVQQIIGGQWSETVNSPKITADMTPIYWDDANNEITTNSSDVNWFNYDENKWANAKTSDGSYWVWIPRYEYKILNGEGTSTAGEIDIKFISKDTTIASEGYKIHPAFIDGTANKYANGEWDFELSGIWIMKYEASSSNLNAENGGGDVTNLNVLSVPGVTSWRGITTGNSYVNAYNYDRSKESHMMKNSEWGAVAYLTQSKYGRKNTEVSINSSSSFYTGGGIGEEYKKNINQSSTGNIYGIYDLSGGAWERTSGYIYNGDSNLSYGSSYAISSQSTKYATVYPYDVNNDRSSNNYNIYKQLSENNSKYYGDAILETSSGESQATSWYGDYSTFSNDKGPFFVRGGNFKNDTIAGIFAYGRSPGDIANNHNGFRTCLAF